MTDHRECRNCGRKHDFNKWENCPAFGKTCNKCRKPNHFAVKCSPNGHDRLEQLKKVRKMKKSMQQIQEPVSMNHNVSLCSWIVAITCGSK